MSALLVAADQLTKFLVVTTFLPGQRVVLGHPFFHLTYVQNTGAAFGLFKGQQAFFILMSVVVIGYLVRELLIRPVMSPQVFWGCVLILGGATGNLIDRLRLGYVIDFLGVGLWPLFNVADSAITIGIGLLLWHSLQRKSS